MLLKSVADNLKTRRVQTLINTHWHPEQTGSNEAVGKAGGTIISHEVSRLALGRKERSALYEGYYGPLPPKAIPTLTTYNTGTLMFAGEQVDYRYLPAAHTNGDLFIHFPKRNVIVAGGPVAADHWPVMDYLNGAFMHGFVRSYEILAEVAKARYHHHSGERSDADRRGLRETEGHVLGTVQAVLRRFQQGLRSERHRSRASAQGFEAQYGDPAQFLDYAYRSLQLATIPPRRHMRLTKGPSDLALLRLALRVGRALAARDWRVATAESCTAGWVAKDAHRCPRQFGLGEGGLCRLFKRRQDARSEGVPWPRCAVTGPSARPRCARWLGAQCVPRVLKSPSQSRGIAGPDGGTPDKPVGTVWLAIAERQRRVRAARNPAAFPATGRPCAASAVAFALQLILQHAVP